jgi:hypothetical protein
MAGVAAALMAACGALGSAYTVEEGCREAQSEARTKALKSLQGELFALKVGEKKTVKEFIEATDLPKTELVRSLLQGVVEYRPPRVYGDGDCEVRVGLSGDALRANLKRILQQDYKEQGGEFSKTTFDGVGGKGLEADATAPVALPPRTGADVSEGVPGWDRDASGQPISALKRIETEHAAYLEGLAALKGDVEQLKIGEGQTLGALMDSNPLVKETIGKFLAKLLADRKLYWPKGIVEVRFALDAGALWTALEQANQNGADPKRRLPADLLAAARERTKNLTLTSSGFAQLDGKPVNSADVVETAGPLDLNAMAEPPLPQFEQAK